MNTKSFLLILLVVCIVGFVAAKPQEDPERCGENEVFTTCGTACPPRCHLRLDKFFCIQECVVGCQCKPGYLLNRRGRCVLPGECWRL